MSKVHKRKYLIIDAYNVMNAVPEFGKGMDKDLESARENLIQRMIELGHYTEEQVVVVFDAYLVKSNVEKIEQRSGVEIVYTKYTQTADSYIEGRVSQLSVDIRNEIRVVTKDLAEQMMVMGKGAVRVLPRELYYECMHMGKTIRRKYHTESAKDSLANRLSDESIEILRKLSKD